MARPTLASMLSNFVGQRYEAQSIVIARNLPFRQRGTFPGRLQTWSGAASLAPSALLMGLTLKGEQFGTTLHWYAQA